MGDGWLPMDSAPRDGTIVEIMCTCGVAPWYGLHQWTDNHSAIGNGGLTFFKSAPQWRSYPPNGHGVADEESLKWRPYTGDIKNYVDPTNGYQHDDKYWRGAVARKYGLPLDHFEQKKHISWWERLLNLRGQS